MQNGRSSLVELRESELDLVGGGISIEFPGGTAIGVAGPGGSVTVGQVVAQSGPASFSFGFLIGPGGLKLDYPIAL